jgi:Zn-dependent protease with chaperone function
MLAGACPFALMALGAARRGRLGAAALPIALALVVVELSLAGMLALRGRVVDGPWLAGLPLAAALEIYGIFLLPLAVIALGFALSFRRFRVAEADLERLRRLAPKDAG